MAPERTEAPEDLEARLLRRQAELELAVEARTAELRAIQNATLNMMEDAVEARNRAEEARAQVYREVEERLRLEAQLRQSQKLESLGILAAGVAHDFNNLIMAINGFSDLALEDLPPDHPVRREIVQVREAGARAETLTRQLLAFSRQQPMKPESLDLNAVLRGMRQMLRRLIRENVELVTSFDPTLGPVLADRGQLEQVLLNLVVNARDALPGGGRIELTTRSLDLGDEAPALHPAARPGPWALVEVRDDGCGMDSRTLERIFDPFFTTKASGTGLGLATALGIVAQCGGFIRVESAPGAGTTFGIHLPRAAGAAEGATPAPAPPPPQGRGQTILVVEDDPPLLRMLAKVLVSGGYTVLEAANGEEALTRVAASAPVDLILADLVMPTMGGPELLERLSRLQAAPQVLFMSGHSDHPIARGEGPGADHPFIAKPFTREDLLEKVGALLSG